MGGNNNDFVFGQIADQPPHMVLLVGVQAVGGFIQDQHLGVVQNGLSESHAAFEALGKRVNGLFADTAQINIVDNLFYPAVLLGAAITTNLGNKRQKLHDGHIRVAGRSFGQIADQGFGGHGVSGDVMTIDGDGARTGGEKSGDDFHGSGLAGAVWAEKSKHFTFGNRETEVVHSRKMLKFSCYMIDFDHVVICLSIVAGQLLMGKYRGRGGIFQPATRLLVWQVVTGRLSRRRCHHHQYPVP